MGKELSRRGSIVGKGLEVRSSWMTRGALSGNAVGAVGERYGVAVSCGVGLRLGSDLALL